jgi:mycobactin phenyloxazoline synthetase
VLAVAAALDVAGVRRSDTVAVLGPKNVEQVIALLAISALGAVYVPIGVDQPEERAARMLANAGVRMALVCGDEPPTTMPALTVTEALRVGRRAAGFAPRPVDPAEQAYVLFTSGSTGEPKGVEMAHDAAMNTVEFINGHFEIGPGDRCLALSTLEGDLSVLDIFGMLRAGGSLVVVDEEHRRDPDTWARLIERHGVTVLHFMPGWLEMLAEVDGDLSSLRVVPTGGDWVRPELVRTLRKRAPRMRFAGLGGATETATHNTVCEVIDISAMPADWTSVPLGVPLPNNLCRVVGADGRDCPDWVPGELWVGGRGVARGYCGRPDLTAQRFVRHDGRTWYRTGDLVRYRPGGVIEFVGRADHRIKVSGYRVELGDVESALRGLAGVESAVATVVSAAGGREVLAALVSAEAGAAGLEPQKLAAGMAELVPPHMIPQIIVTTDQVPYTVGGKLDRAAVARRLAGADILSGIGYRTPATALESALSTIIGSVLGRTGVGADDDFFAIGGDSVLATQVVARLRTWLDTPTVAVADIFATRTVAALAARLTAAEADSSRLTEVAELYLEVAGMDTADVVAALESDPATGR